MALPQHNAKVYVASRDPAKSESAIRELKASTGREAVFLKLDLGNLASVKAAAGEFLSKETRLDILVNNAGVMVPSVSSLTSDGYDLQFGTNVLGHHYFTKLLLPLLISTAKLSRSSNGNARIVTVSSSAHTLGSLNIEAFKDTPVRAKVTSFKLYCQSKLGNIVLASELDRRYRAEGIVSVSFNPGNIRSDLQRHMGSFFRAIVRRTILPSVPSHNCTRLHLLQLQTSEERCDLSTFAQLVGKYPQYLVPWARIGSACKDARDPELGQALWEWCEEQIKDV